MTKTIFVCNLHGMQDQPNQNRSIASYGIVIWNGPEWACLEDLKVRFISVNDICVSEG